MNEMLLMSPPTLETLPVEVLVFVCEYLDREQRSSLVAFACASKHCYSVTPAILFRTIKISVLSGPNLARSVQGCYDMLQHQKSFKHVRRLVVDDEILQCGNSEGRSEHKYKGYKPNISAKELGYDNGIFDDIEDSVFMADNKPVLAVHQTNDAWRPLADLIKQLPFLTDLIYGCTSQFPPCLLQMLHEYQPRCRLHIRKFKLRSLNDPKMDAYEYMLATSPCLYSIRVHCGPYSGLSLRMPRNFNFEAAIALAGGLAPNLKEVQMDHYVSRRDSLLQQAQQEPWKGFKIDDSILEDGSLDNGSRDGGNASSKNTDMYSYSLGSLRCLRHSGHSSTTKPFVEKMRSYINISVLEVLELGSAVNPDAIEYLATDCDFPSLKKLVLSLIARKLSPRPTSDYFATAKRFLCNLPLLSTLKLVGELHSSDLESVIDHHGSCLQELSLSPSQRTHLYSMGDIKQFGRSCPLLEVLALTIYRNKGDVSEVGAYKALGSFPKLQNLILTLDASNSTVMSDDDDNPNPPNARETPSDPSFDKFDQKYFLAPFGTHRSPRNGHIRDAFINSAVDETLARAIFRTITAAKPKSSLPLERLEIQVTGGGRFGQRIALSSIDTVIWNLGRSWLIERHPRDDRRHELICRELGQQNRVRRAARSTVLLRPDVETIFRRIWPAARQEGSDWQDDWHSLPLSIADT